MALDAAGRPGRAMGAVGFPWIARVPRGTPRPTGSGTGRCRPSDSSTFCTTGRATPPTRRISGTGPTTSSPSAFPPHSACVSAPASRRPAPRRTTTRTRSASTCRAAGSTSCGPRCCPRRRSGSRAGTCERHVVGGGGCSCCVLRSQAWSRATTVQGTGTTRGCEPSCPAPVSHVGGTRAACARTSCHGTWTTPVAQAHEKRSVPQHFLGPSGFRLVGLPPRDRGTARSRLPPRDPSRPGAPAGHERRPHRSGSDVRCAHPSGGLPPGPFGPRTLTVPPV